MRVKGLSKKRLAALMGVERIECRCESRMDWAGAVRGFVPVDGWGCDEDEERWEDGDGGIV